ncbi:MAG TPA: hypothetical protein DGH68_04345, partial [Bacteroidetes bacterium]|nr:hypothetical protein [Bacteroidota bacterium]
MKPFANAPQVLLALVFTTLSTCSLSVAQWSSNPTVNNPICTSTGNQRSPSIITDGAGGAIITWGDARNGNGDVFAQRINEVGVVEWTANGIAISTAALGQEFPKLVSDGAGGAIIAWQDNRPGLSNYDIYVRRITASGAVQWTADGVPICVLAGIQGNPQIVSDGIGGAIITWEDARGTNYDIYAQRIDSTGLVQWTANGVAVCTAAATQRRPMIATDGAGGAIITWYDQRAGDNDVYTQRINAAGAVQWTANGVVISTATNFQTNPSIASDGSGGAIIAWGDFRNGANYDIYAQRINAAGAVQWTPDGDTVCVAAGAQESPVIVSDGTGGAIITWQDSRSGSTNYNIYAQRVGSSGVGQWATDGALVSGAANDQAAPTIEGDGTGGAIIAWHDHRTNGSFDIFAQHMSALGAAQWTPNGVAVSTPAEDQTIPAIIGDSAGGAIIVWEDKRPNPTWDIYATKIFADGALPIQLASFTGVALSSHEIRLQWTTLTETNNYGFHIQKRREGETEWGEIANSFIPGHGTTIEPHSYEFVDVTASVGAWLYRLKQTDLDGTADYSEPIQIDV